MRSTLFALLLATHVALGAVNPSEIIQGLPFAVPTEVDWQGSLPSAPEAEQQELIDALAMMFRYVHKNAPAGRHLLNWEGARSLLAKKRARVIFTDAAEIQVRPPIGDAPSSMPVLFPFGMQNLVLRAGPSRDVLFFLLIVRVDRCVYKSRGNFRPDAFLGVTTALAGQLFGYAPALFMETNYLDVVNPDIKVNGEAALAGRQRSLEAEARFLDLFLENAGAKGYPADQAAEAKVMRERVFQLRSEILLTNIKDPTCSQRVQNN